MTARMKGELCRWHCSVRSLRWRAFAPLFRCVSSNEESLLVRRRNPSLVRRTRVASAPLETARRQYANAFWGIHL